MVTKKNKNWVHFQPMMQENRHPKTPTFFFLGGGGRCGWGSFAI